MVSRTTNEDEPAWHSGKKFPLAVLVAILIQTGSLVSWGARFDERTTVRLEDHERRILRGEILDDKYVATNSELFQRLSRIEERSTVSLTLLKDMKDTLQDQSMRSAHR